MDRERFVPPGSEDEAELDEPIPIGAGQVTSQPSLVACMVDALELHGTERVPEIGTGYGYQTAIPAELAGEVHSIERLAQLARAARANLETTGMSASRWRVGDGTLGHPESAPYEGIVVSAAAPCTKPSWTPRWCR